jgi:hypothetical protein
MTFQDIIRLSPEVRQLRDDAASVAVHERWAWYPLWISGSKVFGDAIRAAGVRLDADPQDIRRVALAGLLDAYHVARRRAKREAAA